MCDDVDAQYLMVGREDGCLSVCTDPTLKHQQLDAIIRKLPM